MAVIGADRSQSGPGTVRHGADQLLDSSALLAVMTALSDFSAVNLDRVWHTHVLVVQARLGCGRGVMFDTINVPREGVAKFCAKRLLRHGRKPDAEERSTGLPAQLHP